MDRERDNPDRILLYRCLAAMLIALLVSILSYPEWKTGLATFRNDVEIVAASRGDGQFVAVSWDDPASPKKGVRVPVQHPEAAQDWQVEFTYLGAKDPRSKATEVWILQIAAPNTLAWSLVPPSPGWEFRYQALGRDYSALVAHNGPPHTRTLTIRGGTLSIELLRDYRGGLLRLTVNGNPQEINLYSPTPEIATFTWQPGLPFAQLSPPQRLQARIESDRPVRSLRVSAEPAGRVEISAVRLGGKDLVAQSPGVYTVASSDWPAPARATVASVLTFLMISAALILVTIIWRRQERVPSLLLRIAAPIAAITISLFWTAVFFPCLMSPDSFESWQQAVSGEYDNWHPIGMALVMRGVHLLLNAWPMELQLAAVAFLQGAIFWGAIFTLVTARPVSGRQKVVSCVLAAMYYPLWTYTTTLWKDVWFTIAFLGLVLCARPVLAGQPCGWRRWIAMAAWITFALLNRHTVAMSFLALTTASVVFLWARRGRIPALRTLALGLSALLFALALQKTLDRVLQVRDVGQLSNLMAVDEVVGTVRFSNQPVSSFQNLATYRAVGAASFEQAIRDYSCGGLATYLMYFPGSPFDLRSLTQSSFALQDLPRLALTNPGGYLHHRACAAAAVLEMSSGELFYPYHTQIDPNRFGLRDRSMLPHVRSFVLGFLERASSYRKWMLLQIAFRHWLVLAASLAAAVYSFLGTVFKRLHSPERMMPAYLFACGCVVLLPFLIASGNDWRYLMPANICWVLGIAIAVQLRVNWPEHPPST